MLDSSRYIPSMNSRVMQFGAFEIDPAAGELRKNGLRVRIQQQPLEVLLALLEHPGEVVSRDTLHARLWPNDTFVDFERGLNAAVRRLREALGESAEQPVFIETLSKRGYRFMGHVNGHAPSRPLPVAETVKALSKAKHRLVITTAIVAAAVIATIAVISFRIFWPTARPPIASA